MSSLLFNVCEAICQNSGPRAPGTREEASSRQGSTSLCVPAGTSRLRVLRGGGAGFPEAQLLRTVAAPRLGVPPHPVGSGHSPALCPGAPGSNGGTAGFPPHLWVGIQFSPCV